MSIDTNTIVSGVKKYPVLVAASVVSIALIAWLYTRSDLGALQQAELDKFSAEGSRYRANIANSAQLREQLDFLIQANNAVKERAFKTESMALTLQYFYRLEAETGVKYLDLRPGSRPTGASNATATYVPINYTVNVQGDLTHIITFLKRLEQGVYFSRINSAQASGGASMVTLNLNLDLLGVP